MRIRSIFEEIKDTLYAVAYDDGKNILDVLQDNWSDAIWLEDFFETNKSDLQSGFFGSISIEDAIESTIDEADELFIKLKEQDGANIPHLFYPLDDREFSVQDFQKQKLKGSATKSWLRIYAIHVYDTYIITGGAIKLTHKMNERYHTKQELNKLEIVRNALKLNELESLFVYLDI